jgi:hypothetical protein
VESRADRLNSKSHKTKNPLLRIFLLLPKTAPQFQYIHFKTQEQTRKNGFAPQKILDTPKLKADPLLCKLHKKIAQFSTSQKAMQEA